MYIHSAYHVISYHFDFQLDLIARSLKVPKMSLSSNEAWQINHGNMSDGYDQVSRFHVLVNSTKYKSVV